MPEEVNDPHSPGKEKLITPQDGGAASSKEKPSATPPKETPTPPSNKADPNLKK